MNPNHKILYHCGENSSHRLLLVRTGSHCDSWRSYVYDEATGQTVFKLTGTNGSHEAFKSAQIAAVKAGVSPITHDKQEFAA